MRPKIGLALGSGGARGWAHIGIIEGLVEVGVTPDIVCGTSMGSLVGAAYACGKLDALKSRVESFSRRDVAAMLDLSLTKGGLIEGRKIESFLESLGISQPIESLPLRYGAVATDLRSGREVWFDKGPIGRAVRASIAIPGVLSPAAHEDDSWLVDGGVVNPVPVSLARAMGADIVIAVRLNTDLLEQRPLAPSAGAAEPPFRVPQWLSATVNPILERVLQAAPDHPSYFEVLSNCLDIMEDRITRMRLAGEPPEILLRPALGDCSWLDFHRAKEAIVLGRACVADARDKIRHLCRL